MPLNNLTRHSARLIGQARLQGEETILVLVASQTGSNPKVSKVVEGLGGIIRYRADEVDYLRVRMPVDDVSSLAQIEEIESFEVDFERRPYEPIDPKYFQNVGKIESSSPPDPPTPLIEPYLPITDIDAVGFLHENPSFDGRGVGFALIDGHPDLLLPELQTAMSIDGKPIPKVVDIFSVTDPIDDFDPSWIDMGSVVTAKNRRFEHDEVSYTAPHDGKFRFGLFEERALFDPNRVAPHMVGLFMTLEGNPPGTSGPFGVLWDEQTNTVWMDTDRDRDFSEEIPLTDFGVRGDFGIFGKKFHQPPGKRESVAFAIQTNPKERFVRVCLGDSIHGTGVIGAAVGSNFLNGAYSSIAGGAELISITSQFIAHGVVEAMIAACRHPKVDVICPEPGQVYSKTARMIMDRALRHFNKLALSPAGNYSRLSSTLSVSEDGSTLLVGGYESAENLRVNSGVKASRRDNMHMASSFGPGTSGELAPDLISPSNVIGLRPACWEAEKVKGVYELPHGYWVVGGTSTAGPTAAAATALLISAAKQSGVRWDAQRLRSALLSTARFIPGVPAYQQGRGLVQVGAAWKLLKTMGDDWAPIDISVKAPLVTAKSKVYGQSVQGRGLYEREGWSPKQTETRTITLTRTSGSDDPIEFSIQWLGDTSSFTSAQTVTLPLNEPVEVEVKITTGPDSDVYSAIMRLTNEGLVGSAIDILNTVTAAVRLGADSEYKCEIHRTVPRPGVSHAFIEIPEDTPALLLEIETLTDRALESWAGVFPLRVFPPDHESRGHDGAGDSEETESGGNSWTAIRPRPGTWGISIRNFGFEEAGLTPPDNLLEVADTPVTLKASLLGVEASPSEWKIDPDADGPLVHKTLAFRNRFGPFYGGAERGKLGSAFVTRRSISEGERHVYEIDVPKGSELLQVAIQIDEKDAELPLYLYQPLKNHMPYKATLGKSRTFAINEPAAGIWTVIIEGFKVPQGSASYRYHDQFTHEVFGKITVEEEPAERPAGSSWDVKATARVKARPATGRYLSGLIPVKASVPGDEPKSIVVGSVGVVQGGLTEEK